MATNGVIEEFVTIVPVGENQLLCTGTNSFIEKTTSESSFVTVVKLGILAGAAEIIVSRPRGARLGLGLKFEGGSAASEKVRRLLVQSCAENSPAANACTPWGNLIPGDEILAIDGVSVSELTRIDCVRRLKESDEILTLLVKHLESDSESGNVSSDTVINMKKNIDIVRPTLPPPVPPRKIGKKNSFKDKPPLQTVGEQEATETQKQQSNDKGIINITSNGSTTVTTKLSRKSSFDSHIHRQNKDTISSLKRGSPEEVRRLVRRLSDGKNFPPEAEVYIDLLSTEWEKCLSIGDAESDDTGSSISTVVDRLSSMASSVENSIPSTPILQPKTIDIQKVLNCIENIDTDLLKEITCKTILDTELGLKNETVTEKHNTVKKDLQESIQNVDSSQPVVLVEKKLVSKTTVNKNNNTDVLVKTSNESEKLENTHLIKKSEAPTKHENTIEKPKPMPRTTKLGDKKPKSLQMPDVPPPPVPDCPVLLTPTKKNCIETWLQHSEAEMHTKIADGTEVEVSQEVLPRLIDFVPKPQFKENELTTIVRPTKAPPPPPSSVEQREDGSGASLDTIGELDESSDVVDSKKPLIAEKETKERKSSYESGFWEERVNKSDAEDKNFSNDESLLPNCPRQPPDGVETPADVVEKVPDITKLPHRLSSGWPTRSRPSYMLRTQDARSEASVKDKIAMFSNNRSSSSDQIEKCGTLPSKTKSNSRKSSMFYTNSYSSESSASSLERRLTKSQDNLDELPRITKCNERPEVLGAQEGTSIIHKLTNCQKLQADNKPIFYASATTLPSFTEPIYSQSIYHSRSSSEDSGSNCNHKSNLEYLIEQRRKSMSKLRGLIIPESNQAPLIGLPEIKVQDSIVNSQIRYPILNGKDKNLEKKYSTKLLSLSESKWKTELLSNNLPKYSPAFKRKSLQVYSPTSLSKESTPEPKLKNNLNKKFNETAYKRSPRSSLDIKSYSDLSAATLPQRYSMNNTTINKDILNNARSYSNMEIKICTITDIVDSDNDSAMSSTQSSYRSSASSPLQTLESIESDSSRMSPKVCLVSAYSFAKDNNSKPSKLNKTSECLKRNVCRSVSSDTNASLSSSAGSAATSGSQASCSSLENSAADSEKKNTCANYNNVDTINRRNILASAKCRSGRDANLSSPVMETKFSHQTIERSPSPKQKASDRLSTLTTSASAIMNKGERRRNKIIAESDSDSDTGVNVRQRKNEFKNTRLKRNSSSSNKNRANEVDTTKVEDGPKLISERIIQEIKKAGIDNNSNTVTTNANNEKNKTDDVINNKQDSLNTMKSLDVVDISIPNSNTNPDYSMIDGSKTTATEKSNSKLNNCNGKVKLLVEDSKGPTRMVHLKRGAGTGVGLILAGGCDCEAKDVTVHRVLADSVADKAGLMRGVKVRSINGSSMAGLTHAQSVAVLKEQRSEVVIEIEETVKENGSNSVYGSDNTESSVSSETNEMTKISKNESVFTVVLEKAGGGAGLGFGLDGGRDSPQGDRPLTIKKLFAGGAAARSGRVPVGAELISAGGQNMEGFTRTQAWAALKALPAGPVTLVLNNTN